MQQLKNTKIYGYDKTKKKVKPFNYTASRISDVAMS